MEELESIRRQGYAVDDREFNGFDDLCIHADFQTRSCGGDVDIVRSPVGFTGCGRCVAERMMDVSKIISEELGRDS